MELAELNQRIRQTQRRLKRAREEVEEVGPQLSILVRMVYVFSGYDLEAAAELLARRLEPRCFDEFLALAQDVCLRAPASAMASLAGESCLERHSLRAMALACRFIVELRLFWWVRCQNYEHGVAPTRAQLVRFAVSVAPSDVPLKLQGLVRQPLLGSARRQRKWLQRFRAAWGARLGRLRALGTTPLHEMQEKAQQGKGVGPAFCFFAVNWKLLGPPFAFRGLIFSCPAFVFVEISRLMRESLFWGPFFTPQNGARKETLDSEPRFGARVSGPKRGLAFGCFCFAGCGVFSLGQCCFRCRRAALLGCQYGRG